MVLPSLSNSPFVVFQGSCQHLASGGGDTEARLDSWGSRAPLFFGSSFRVGIPRSNSTTFCKARWQRFLSGSLILNSETFGRNASMISSFLLISLPLLILVLAGDSST
ncbi:hypothetical protein EYC84_008289 [Monilinia fructicola]|uniref:Uncharacterized protein n=1 Tax=Monilinia fructicola TaxID=38448 RepID=A0A5M9JEN8_MONFR|nr:hypothetical protein EYC84_008289 [Monilinia fructicola]